MKKIVFVDFSLNKNKTNTRARRVRMLHKDSISSLMIVKKQSITLFKISRNREHKSGRMPTKKPLSLLGISRRTIPSIDEILRGFTQRVAKKKGGKTQHSVSPWHSERQEKKEGSMAAHVVLSYIYTYIRIFFK